MTGFSRQFRALVPVGVLLAFLAPAALATDAAPPLTGVVSDALGNLLDGVQILVLPERIGAPPAGAAWTAGNGRFSVDGLRPGVYRVAAVKSGYRTYLGRIDTALRSSIDLVLRPSPELGAADEPLPTDAAWSLRLPERSVLRHLDPEPVPLAEAARGGTGADPLPRFDDAVGGSVEQTFAVAGGPVTGTESSLAVAGSETRMSVSAPLHDHATMLVRGYRQSFTAQPSTGGVASRRDGAALEWGMDYHLGMDDHLAVNAFYDRGRLDLPDFAPHVTEQAQRSWGYDATWSRRLDPASRVRVRMDYRDTSMELPGSVIDELDVRMPGPIDAGDVANRMMGAATSFESLAGERHQVKVDVRAQRLDTPVEAARTARRAALLGLAAQTGWTVGVDAEDAWALSTPVTLLYGLTYHENLEIPDSGLVVPRLGAVWNRAGVKVRALVSYSTSAQDPGHLPEHIGRIAAESAFGYDLSVEAPLPLGFTVKGTYVHEPVHYALGGGMGPGNVQAGRPVFVTDGNVRTRRDSLAVERGFGANRAFIELSRGQADGTVAAVPVFDVPVYLLADRSLRYATGRLGVRVASSGTEILAAFQSVDELVAGTDRSPATPSPASQHYVALNVVQDLPGLGGGSTSWRLLLAARTSSAESTAGGIPEPGVEALDLLGRQFSAGVSVAF